MLGPYMNMQISYHIILVRCAQVICWNILERLIVFFFTEVLFTEVLGQQLSCVI